MTIVRRFDGKFPGRNVTRLKKVDLVLWQVRDQA
jgi:hypothetical protein